MNAVAPDVPGTFRQDDGTSVPFLHAKLEWAHAGYDTLVDVARNPDAHITYDAIADELQRSTGIRTDTPPPDWIATPLALVAEMCVRNGEPQLTALVVSADTLEVGDGFASAYSIAGQPIPRNLQRAAAELRIACYDYFSRREPGGWDKTKLTGRIGTPRLTPVRKPAKAGSKGEAPPRVCATCRLELLPSGRCGYCD
jgi:hypothetical protein